MKELTDFLDKYGVEYTIDGEPVFVPGDLEIEDQELTRLPESFVGLPESFGNLKIGGSVFALNALRSQRRLRVGGQSSAHTKPKTTGRGRSRTRYQKAFGIEESCFR